MKNGHWTTRRLDECATFLSGGTPSKSKPDYWTGDIPWVSCKDMKSDRLYDAEDHVSEAGAEAGTRMVDAGTVLIVVRGMILAKEFPVAVAMRQMAFNQDLKAVRPEPDLDSGFLYYWLKANTPNILGIADEAAHGTKRLQSDRLGALAVSYPPLEQQKSLVAPLVVIDDLIDVNRKRIGLLEEMARRVYEEWFVQFRFPGHKKVRHVGSPAGRIPAGWRTCPWRDVVTLSHTTCQPSGSNTLWEHYSLPSYDAGRRAVVEPGSSIASAKLRITPPCILISKLNPKIKRVWMVSAASEFPQIASTEFLVLTAKLSLNFIFETLRSDGFSRTFAQYAQGTSTSHQRVAADTFLSMPLLLPSDEVVAAAHRLLKPIHDAEIVLRTINDTLTAKRNALLPHLMAGTLR